jgi:hypothetical protein
MSDSRYTVVNPTLTSEWRRTHPQKKVVYKPDFVQAVLVNGCCGKKKG